MIYVKAATVSKIITVISSPIYVMLLDYGYIHVHVY